MELSNHFSLTRGLKYKIMGNEISFKYGSPKNPHRRRACTYEHSSPLPARAVVTPGTPSNASMRSATSIQSGSSTLSDLSDDISTASSLSQEYCYQRRKSTISHERNSPRINTIRTLSLRGVQSEPKHKETELNNNIIESDDVVAVMKKKHKRVRRRRLASILSSESELMDLYEIQENVPLYINLKPLFHVNDTSKLITKFLMTITLKQLSMKKVAQTGQMWEAQIQFYEAGITLGDQDKKTENTEPRLVRAFTWSGQTKSVQLSTENIKFIGHFTHHIEGALRYLEFELILRPCRKSNITNQLIVATRSVSLIGSCSTENLEVDDENPDGMLGTFMFKDTRNTKHNTEFFWAAKALRNVKNGSLFKTLSKIHSTCI
ncbi:uncharacterized protein LOC130631464 isoform X2 [Hydractinia symbiolongicarpus]|uniref:uncharacterized protein LOC130631464 isoform X2 n=1 Tax=Hydractinia symbiolongicarpus TaxID=13093 RepID=UPI00254FCC0E|nr:uncharacterized protein LOC130631464 isoform X2 [Hydractinia symbiolongicarpus]